MLFKFLGILITAMYFKDRWSVKQFFAPNFPIFRITQKNEKEKKEKKNTGNCKALCVSRKRNNDKVDWIFYWIPSSCSFVCSVLLKRCIPCKHDDSLCRDSVLVTIKLFICIPLVEFFLISLPVLLQTCPYSRGIRCCLIQFLHEILLPSQGSLSMRLTGLLLQFVNIIILFQGF